MDHGFPRRETTMLYFDWYNEKKLSIWGATMLMKDKSVISPLIARSNVVRKYELFRNP